VGRFAKVGPALAVAVAVGGVAGCTPAGEQAARQTAEQFQSAVRSGDSAAACRLLSDEARGSLEAASTRPCPAALAALRLPAGPPGHDEVWGGNAQVLLGSSGALFLADFRAGWRVTAAGCTSRPDQPYDCQVEG
jgi:hypothetical protein